MNIGTMIKDKRAEKGIRQIDLAMQLGVGTSTISRWEKGDVKGLKAHMIKKLCVALGVEPTAFIDTPMNEENESLVVIENGLMQYIFKREPKFLKLTNIVTPDGELYGIKLNTDLLRTVKFLIMQAIGEVKQHVPPDVWYADSYSYQRQRRIKAKKDPDQ